MCTLAYVLLLEELRWRCQTQVLAATLARSMGSDVEVPDWDEVRGQFDALLVREPPRTDPDQLVLETALGLRR